MIERLVIFFAILTRVSAFFLILPIFGWQILPVRFKMVLTVLLSIFFCAVVPVKIDVENIWPLRIILLLAGEATYGLALGLIVVCLFSVVKVAGMIVGILITILQAVTSIRDMTLTIVPKLLAVGAVMLLFGNWMLQITLRFTAEIFTQIQNVMR